MIGAGECLVSTRIASSVVVTFVVSLLLAAAPTSSQAEPAAVDSDPFVQAQAADEPVEIVAERTPTDTVFANPDGTFTREVSSSPFRVESADGWKDIDRTLAFADDGSVKPKVLDADVVLSGGGNDPLIKSVTSGVSTSVSWDGALPRPLLDGSTATYPEILEGVDLRVSVSDVGTTTVLVVKDVEAAANPELQRIAMPVEVEGGQVVQGDGGALVIEDDFGRSVAESSQPAMWDSSGVALDAEGTPITDDPAAEVDARTLGPAQGDVIEEIPTTVGSDEIVLEPTEDALVGDDVQYPLFVDPTVGRDSKARAMVHHHYPSSSFYNWSADSEGVGYQSYEPWSRKRLFYRFSSSAFKNAYVKVAEFRAARKHSASCSTATINLYEVRGFSSSTTWNNQPSWSSSRFQDEVKDSEGFTGCNSNSKWLEWNATKAMRAIADEGRSNVEFGLRNNSETNERHWRRFGQTAKLSVTYSFFPGTPRNLSHEVPNRNCNLTTPMGPDVPYLVTTLSDPDATNGEKVRAEWQLFRGTSTGGTMIWSGESSFKNPSTRYKTLSTDDLNLDRDSNDKLVAGTYTWRVRGRDNSGNGASGIGLISSWSSPCRFTIDPNAPLEPEVTVDDEDGWVFGQAAKTATFAKNPNEPNPGTVRYRWSVNNTEPTNLVDAGTAPDFVATRSLAPARVGYNILRVWAEDAAGNRSAPGTYEFDAIWQGSTNSVKYDFDAGSGPSATNSGGMTGSFDLPMTASQWHFRGLLNGVPDFAAAFDGAQTTATGARALETDNSFTVSAWLDAADTSTPRYALSHDGDGDRSAFRLGVEPNCLVNDITFEACYVFGVYDTETMDYVTAKAPAEVESRPEHTHVVATYNAATKEAAIWLHSEDEAGEWLVTPVSVAVAGAPSAARLVAGAARQGGNPEGPWVGRIDDVLVAQGLTDVGTLKTIHEEDDKWHDCYGTECE